MTSELYLNAASLFMQIQTIQTCLLPTKASCACNLTVFFCNILFHLAERPFTRSGKALKEDMMATLPSWKEKTQPTPPDVSIMVDDSSDGSEHKNLTSPSKMTKIIFKFPATPLMLTGETNLRLSVT